MRVPPRGAHAVGVQREVRRRPRRGGERPARFVDSLQLRALHQHLLPDEQDTEAQLLGEVAVASRVYPVPAVGELQVRAPVLRARPPHRRDAQDNGGFGGGIALQHPSDPRPLRAQNLAFVPVDHPVDHARRGDRVVGVGKGTRDARLGPDRPPVRVQTPIGVEQPLHAPALFDHQTTHILRRVHDVACLIPDAVAQRGVRAHRANLRVEQHARHSGLFSGFEVVEEGTKPLPVDPRREQIVHLRRGACTRVFRR